MAGKRYYWLKLQVGFFQELIIKQLRTLPEGDSIVLLNLKLLLKAINTEGIIYYQNILPSLDEEIALDTGEKPALVKLTISACVNIMRLCSWTINRYSYCTWRTWLEVRVLQHPESEIIGRIRSS